MNGGQRDLHPPNGTASGHGQLPKGVVHRRANNSAHNNVILTGFNTF